MTDVYGMSFSKSAVVFKPVPRREKGRGHLTRVSEAVDISVDLRGGPLRPFSRPVTLCPSSFWAPRGALGAGRAHPRRAREARADTPGPGNRKKG